MIKLKRDNLIMEVGTQVQASAFIRNGWKQVGEDKSESAVSENKTESQYKKSEISRMSTDDLRKVAKSVGIEVTEESTGAKLKEEIIEKLGL